MTDFRIEAAGVCVAVRAMLKETGKYCKEYICDRTPAFSVTVTPEDIAFEQEKANREAILEGLPVQKMPDYLLERTALQRKITEGLFDHDVLLFHGSVVAVDGAAYLFTAKSGTGKSTHTRFWRETFGDRAVMVNDDKPFLRITPEGVLVYGSPWNGKHGLGNNICVPLKAICVLERGQENQIQKISAKDALFMLLQQSNRPMQPRLMPKYLELLDKLSAGVALYRMQCTMDPMAAQIAYDAMSK